MALRRNIVKKTGLETLRRMAGLAMLSPWYTALAVLTTVCSAATYFFPYIAIWKIMNLLTQDIFGTQALYKWGAFALIGISASAIFYMGALSSAHVAAFDISLKLKKKFARHIAELPLGFHIETGYGKLYKLMEDSIGEIQSFLAHKLPDMIVSVMTPVFLACLMFSIDWRYATAIMAGVGIAYFFCVLSNGKGGAKDMMDVYLDAIENLNGEAVEYVRGIEVIRTFGQEGLSASGLQQRVRDYTRLVIPYTLIWEKYRCVFTGLIHNLYLFVLPVGAYLGLVRREQFDVATFVYYLLLTTSVASIVPKIQSISNICLRTLGAVERMDRILSLPVLPEGLPGKVCRDNTVEFEHVSFSYGSGENALTDICFTARPGTLTAVVGASGSGKSTLAYLLARFWDVNAGSIKIGGVDIRELEQKALMQRLSYVFQDSFLFTKSIADNIRGGKTEASRDDIIAAAKAAQCHDFIMKLPSQYETVIGENGVRLSGGEKQRIAIARAILKDAPIIVLDEATASADPENERDIQLAFESLVKRKTVIMIAHRLPSIRKADNILVLKDSVIAETGTHAELIEKQGLYAAMWNSYTQVLQWKIGGQNETLA